jgi:hypothetical protein
MARQRPDSQTEELVLRGLRAAQEVGTGVEALIKRMRAAGYDIKSSYHLVNKYKTGQRSLKSGDVEKMHRFFTKTDFGQFLLGGAGLPAATASVASKVEPPASLLAKISAAGTAKPECLTGTIRLASISIEGTQWGLGTVGISVTIGCEDWFGFAVQRGRVAMDPGSGSLTRDGEAYWAAPREFTTRAYGRAGKVIATLGCSTRYDPFWDLIGFGMPIGKFESDPEFAPLEGLRPGAQITVTFGTWLGDVDAANAEKATDDDDRALLTDGFGPVNSDSQPEAIVDDKGFKRRLISIIRGTGLNAGPDGYVELSRCKLLVAEG